MNVPADRSPRDGAGGDALEPEWFAELGFVGEESDVPGNDTDEPRRATSEFDAILFGTGDVDAAADAASAPAADTPAPEPKQAAAAEADSASPPLLAPEPGDEPAVVSPAEPAADPAPRDESDFDAILLGTRGAASAPEAAPAAPPGEAFWAAEEEREEPPADEPFWGASGAVIPDAPLPANPFWTEEQERLSSGPPTSPAYDNVPWADHHQPHRAAEPEPPSGGQASQPAAPDVPYSASAEPAPAETELAAADRPDLPDDPFLRRVLARAEALRAGDDVPARGAEARLQRILAEPDGRAFVARFVDRVLRAEDSVVANRELERITRELPGGLDRTMRAGAQLGAGLGSFVPTLGAPVAKRSLAGLVAHRVIEAAPQKLDGPVAQIAATGARALIALPHEEPASEAEARHRAEVLQAVLARPGVQDVAVRVSALGQEPGFRQDAAVRGAVDRLRPLLQAASASVDPVRIILDSERARYQSLAYEVLDQLLAQPDWARVELGCTVQAYSPDAVAMAEDLVARGRRRVEAGGAPLRVRVVPGDFFGREQLETAEEGWPLAVAGNATETQARTIQLLRLLLGERAVRVTLRSADPFIRAYAQELAPQGSGLEFERLLGDSGEAAVVYAPLVEPGRMAPAVPYLLRNLAPREAGSKELFLAAAAMAEAGEVPAGASRRQDRGGTLDDVVDVDDAEVREPRTDPSLRANQRWAASIRERAQTSELGAQVADRNVIEDLPTLERRIRTSITAGEAWRARSEAERELVLKDAAVTVGVFRGRLVEVAMAELGLALEAADAEVSDAVDALRFAADRAFPLVLPQAEFRPAALAAAVSSAAHPIAAPAAEIALALAAGVPVLLVPDHRARRTAAVLCEALWEAGVSRELLRLCDIPAAEMRATLLAHPQLERVVFAGSPVAAAEVMDAAAGTPVVGHIAGSNTFVITPAADLEQAARDLTRSASWGGGRHADEVHLAILVGSVGDSQRFRAQLPRHLEVREAPSLAAALTIHNELEWPGTATLYSLDHVEVAQWLRGVRTGAAFVNRPPVDARFMREPYGGWGPAVLGGAAHVGGTRDRFALGTWVPVYGEAHGNVRLSGLSRPVVDLIEAATPKLQFLEFDRVRQAARSDERAWRERFGRVEEHSPEPGLRFATRYLPRRDVTVRLAESGTQAQLVRILVAATRAGARVRLSTAAELPPHLLALAEATETALQDAPVVESDAEFRERAEAELHSGLVRLAGADAELTRRLAGRLKLQVVSGAVATEGLLELPYFLNEQTVSMTTHRYGVIDPEFQRLSLKP